MKGQPRALSFVLASAFLALLGGLAACDSEPPPGSGTAPAPAVSLEPGTPSPPAPSRTPARPANPQAAAVQGAVAAYRGMWQAYDQALSVPDPASPALARYAAGEALRVLVSGVASARGKGLRGVGQVRVSPRVTELSPARDPARVLVEDCMDSSDSRLVRASPGPPYTDQPGGRRRCVAELRRQHDGSWKVTKFGLLAVGTC